MSTAGRYKSTSLFFLLMAGLCALWADMEIVAVDPWFELGRIGLGIVTPDFFATEALLSALLGTLCFALLGVVLGNSCGLVLALLFHWRPVRFFCAFIRAIHELFWALLFIQLFGLSPLSGILAIAIPYSGIFAKVYAEILEEGDQTPLQVLPSNCDRISVFLFAKLPSALKHFRSYSLYRLECGIRSSAVLGFIGLPTLGFHLESAFSQARYSEAAALLYLLFLLIITLKYWMRWPLLPFYLLGALVWLPDGPTANWPVIQQFLSVDIIPSPLRDNASLSITSLNELAEWSSQLLLTQAAPGMANTLTLSLMAVFGSGVLTLMLFPWVSSLYSTRMIRAGGHILLVVFRSIPELILAFVLTLVMGPSMLPAVFALSLHNGAIIGYLIGQYSNTLILRDDSPRGLNRYAFELLPRIYGQFLAFLLYRWEVIMRETAILGILGIHTLGFYIDSAFEDLRFDRAVALILITALLNLLVDSFARFLRTRIKLNGLRQQANC